MGSKSAGPGFYEFLIEAELQQYYNAFKSDLKVQNVTQLKYVSEDDMCQIGMSRPEMRRLTKYFHKHCPQTYLAKMKKKLLYRKDDSMSTTTLSSNMPNVPGRYSRSIAPGRHIIQADALVSHKTLGSGEFGTVQQGVWTSDDGERIQVAIKCLSQERMENNPVEFLKEAAIMHTVDHEHIVRLYGVVLDTSSLVLVTELAPLRSLLECLKEPSMRPNLTVQTLFDFSIQICDGMQYLESKRLIHRDLAARNVLVFSRSKVKISDFGLSRALGVGKDYYQTNFNVNLKLPIAWCASECINFLRFTTASDVWAYGVTLWEMFSYGFQPWAALTGQQILEAIDEPNYQRLEKPDCCPMDIYYQIMLKCWQHDPLNRPTFAQLLNLLPECKPEQVQAIRECESRSRRDFLSFDAGDLITVLDKKPTYGNTGSNGNSGDESNIHWKGVLKCGKSGLFNPANTITYLGSSLPSVKENQGPFSRNDSRSSSIRKGRLSADMISSPQGDLKHTGHVGPDGQFFGDIAFMSAKCWVPRQVVPPYKPESPNPTDLSGSSTPSSRFHFSNTKGHGDSQSEIISSDTAPLLSQSQKSSDSSLQRNRRKLMLPTAGNLNLEAEDGDHEYHEISDEENEIMATSRASGNEAIGLSNPALSSKSQSPLDSPRFEKTFDLGPSLMDEVFGALERDHQEQTDEANVKNELREMSRQKKKFATVKPISSKDRKTLDHAIAIANEMASRSMLDLDRHGKHGHGSNSFDDISSPRTPTSPTHRKKFSFILGGNKNQEQRRNYSQEAASIPDIQSTLTEEAKEAYNSLIDKPSSIGSLGFLTPSFENKSSSFHFPEKCSSLSKKSAFFDNEPLSPPPPTSNSIFQTSNSNSNSICCTNSTGSGTNSSIGSKNSTGFIRSHTKSLSCTAELSINDVPIEVIEDEDEVDRNPLRLLRQNKVPNVLPLPPRERRKFVSSKSFDGSVTTSSMVLIPTPLTNQNHQNPTRHQRKHPLLIPGKITIEQSQEESVEITRPPPPPPPPPKPLRQNLNTGIIPKKQVAEPETPRLTTNIDKLESCCSIIQSATISTICELETIDNNGTTSSSLEENSNMKSEENENCKKIEIFPISKSNPGVVVVPLYENYEDDLNHKLSESNLDKDESLPNGESEILSKVDSPKMETTVLDFKERRRCFEVMKTEEKNQKQPYRPICRKRSSENGHNSMNHSSQDSEIEIISKNLISNNQNVLKTERISKSPPPQTIIGKETKLPVKSDPVRIIEPEPECIEVKGKFRCSPSKDAILYANPLKIKTVQRILGSSATEKECIWALDICRDDCAHAVKLLRLKSLLPDSLLHEDIERVVSVLEMSHWDVARASSFLLTTSTTTTNKNKTSLRKLQITRSDELNSNISNNELKSDSISSTINTSENVNGNGNDSIVLSQRDLTSPNGSSDNQIDVMTPDLVNSHRSTRTRNSSDSSEGRDYIRPTRV